MKRSLTVILSLVFVFTLAAFTASAEGETYDIIKEGLEWTSQPNGGATCTITWENGEAVISGSTSGTWPMIFTRYESPEIIKVPVADYSLVYDFTVESGYTNFSYYFNTYPYTMANTAFYEDQSGRVDYNTGSGDIGPGVYKGAITLTELTESSTLYGSEKFSQYAVRNGILEFHGMEFFSVDGGIITVRELKLVPTSEVVEDPIEQPDESETPSETPEENSEPAESVPEKNEDNDNNDKTNNSTENVDDISEEEANEEGIPLVVWIVIAVVGVAVIATVVVVVLKKKK